MGILSQMQDELLERKDLRVYLSLRLKQLSDNAETVVEEVKNDPKQDIKDLPKTQHKIKGRTQEIKRLLDILGQRRLKEESKEIWNYLFDKGLVSPSED